MTKILGLDLGTNSIGWAIVEKEKGGKFQLLDKGVRIFQEGVKIEKGIEGSKTAERTGYRSARRIKFRRKLRKIQVLKVLIDFGYCPHLSPEDLDNWRFKKIYPQNDLFREWYLTSDEKKRTPYYYRSIAVTESLNLNTKKDRYKLGRAFYHICQRRGFLSNRLESTKENIGAVKKEISEINQAKGDKTLGQYFWERYQKGEKIRDTYTHREEHYLKEFNRICNFQKLDQTLVEKLKAAIFYQRPLKSQKGLIGKCSFEKNKPRCSVSRPEFEEYRMLCFLNSIKIKSPDDEKMRFLTTEEKETIKPQFFRKSKLHFDFKDIVKKLAPLEMSKYYKSSNRNPEDWLFNYRFNKTVSGCPVSARLKEIFGDDFLNYKKEYLRDADGKQSEINMSDIWHVLYTYDSNDKLIEFAKKRIGLNEQQIEEFLKIHPSKDFASLSLKAINKILPYLRQGLIYSHAVFLANMAQVIPKEIWQISENQELIKRELNLIIKTQNEEKQIIEIVNGMIKTNREENNTWSDEASEIYQKDLKFRIQNHFGPRTYDNFSDQHKQHLENRSFTLLRKHMIKNNGKGEFIKIKRIDERVKDFLSDHFDISESNLNKIYHPSAIDVYKPPEMKDDGKYYLGSPMVPSIKNPMAMRALHQLRKVINELIKNKIIDETTRINIEMSRDLMNANERKAYQDWQRDNESKRREYADKIKEHLNSDAEPSETDILKYQLWEEQKHKCIYTGKEIAISEFLGSNPSYDIEHTIPRSNSFDNSQVNKTLCENHFNRSIKKNRIPYELKNHEEILERIKHWKEQYEELQKQIQIAVRQAKSAVDKESKDRAIRKRHRLRFEHDYLKEKYSRFNMSDVPTGFKNSQIVDTGIITKYARLYLQTLFDKVYTVKGNTVADFRKLWGLQDEYVKKTRVNHIHHCIDAITIACITKENYENLAKFYHQWEEYYLKGIDKLPPVEKPWPTFTEDVKGVENEVLVSHHTPDVLPKQTRKKLRKRGKIQYNKNGEVIYQQGDAVRGSLHQQTFYGAIEIESKNNKGEPVKKIKYVVRKPLEALDDKSLKNIVDDRIKEIVVAARKDEKKLKKEIETLKKKLNRATEEEEEILLKNIDEIQSQIESLYTLPNKNGAPVPIRKVRIFQNTVTNPLHIKEQRDKSRKSRKPYKEHIHVANDGNYLMAIYETKDSKGKIKRDFELVNRLDAGEFFKLSVQQILKAQGLGNINNLFPEVKESNAFQLPLKAVLKIGTMVILWEKKPEEVWELTLQDIGRRMYKIIGLAKNRVKSGKKYYEFGNCILRHHKEARPAIYLRTSDGIFQNDEDYKPQRKLSHNQFNALVEGVDFKLSPLGKLQKI